MNSERRYHCPRQSRDSRAAKHWYTAECQGHKDQLHSGNGTKKAVPGRSNMRRFTAAGPEAHFDTGHIPIPQGLAMGLAPAPSLLHALVRECRDMGPTLAMEVTCIGSLGPSRW